MNKDEYILKIRNFTEKGELLLKMLDEYGKYAVSDITADEAREFWEEYCSNSDRENEKIS